MYNEERKRQFAERYNDRPGLKAACLAAFAAMEKYELGWGADMCTRSAEELRPVVEELIGLRSKSVYLRVGIFRDYVSWCMENDVPGACDGMLHVKPSRVNKMKKQTLKNPTHLQKYLNGVCEPEEEQTNDNTTRCFYWMAYAGMKAEDIVQVTAENIDFDNMVIRYNGEEYPLYREALRAFKTCAFETQFRYKHPNYAPSIVCYRNRVEGTQLLRGLKGTPSANRMRIMISRRAREHRDKIDLELTYNRVWLSGVFYRTYERELAGYKPDFSDVVEKLTEGKTYSLESCRNTITSKKRSWAREYLQDYLQWKQTFC